MFTEFRRRNLQDAGHSVGRGGRPAVRPDVADGRQRAARVRGRRQPDGQVAQPGHADADVPVSAGRERQAARIPAAAQLRLVHGRRGARHVRVRPEERAVRRPVRGAVRRGQTVGRRRVPGHRQTPEPVAQVLFQHQIRQAGRSDRRPGKSDTTCSRGFA